MITNRYHCFITIGKMIVDSVTINSTNIYHYYFQLTLSYYPEYFQLWLLNSGWLLFTQLSLTQAQLVKPSVQTFDYLGT